MAKWGATKVTQHERVSVPPEHYIEDAVEAVRYGDYKLAEKLYAKAYKTALGTQDEKVISDTVKQGLKNLKEHWNHTSPEDFINKAGKAAEEEKYECAERVYLNALRAAQGKPIAGIIAAEVKKRLTAMYLFWSTSYTKNYDFADAEPIILKKLKIADDKAVVKEELLRLYHVWGSWLINEKNFKAAVIIQLRKLRLERELTKKNDYTVSRLCAALYISKDKKDEYAADRIYVCSFFHRFRVLLSAVIYAAAAIVLPVFAPFSIGILIFSFNYPNIDERACLMNDARDNKIIRKAVKWTFSSLICFVILIFFEATDFREFFPTASVILSLVMFVTEALIGIRLMIASIIRFRVFFSYTGPDPLVIAEGYVKDNKIESGELDLRLKNKPVKPSVTEVKKDLQEGVNRAAGGFIHFAVNSILRNLRF